MLSSGIPVQWRLVLLVSAKLFVNFIKLYDACGFLLNGYWTEMKCKYGCDWFWVIICSKNFPGKHMNTLWQKSTIPCSVQEQCCLQQKVVIHTVIVSILSSPNDIHFSEQVMFTEQICYFCWTNYCDLLSFFYSNIMFYLKQKQMSTFRLQEWYFQESEYTVRQ